MKITFENYEAYLLDYIEGVLSDEDKEALVLFLEKYPELKKELQEFRETVLKPDLSIVYHGKESLKRHPSISSPISLGKLTYAAAAAILLVFIMSRILFLSDRRFEATAFKTDSFEMALPVAPVELIEALNSDPSKVFLNDPVDHQENNTIPAIEELLAKTSPDEDQSLNRSRPIEVLEPVDLVEARIIHQRSDYNLALRQRDLPIEEKSPAKDQLIGPLSVSNSVQNEILSWIGQKFELAKESPGILGFAANSFKKSDDQRIIQIELGKFKFYNRKAKKKRS